MAVRGTLSLWTAAAAVLAAAVAPPPGPDLQSSFVWCSSAPPAGQQAYVAFRRTFALAGPAPTAATLHLFADARYWAWVNGVYVARGPGRFDPRSPRFDSLDVGSLLVAGANNSLVLLVHNYGNASINGRIMYHDPGVTARLDVDGAPLLSTDASWACSAATEHQPSPVAWSSIPDVVDMRVAGAGEWTAPGFDDSAWARASAAAAPAGSSWGALLPRELPLPREAPLAGLTLLFPGAPRPLAEALPLTLRPGDSFQVNLGVMAMAVAALELDSSDAGNNLQCIFYIGYVNGAPVEDHGVGCDYLLRGGAQSVSTLDTWVAHYVVFGFSKGAGTITVRNLTVVNRDYPFERVGSFVSSDAALDTIWTYAVNTLVATTDDAYGSDARERNEWLQDPAQPNWITTSVALSPTDFATPASDARLLRQIVLHSALTQEANGVLHATFPTDRGPSDCHWFIEDYALQWVTALRIVFDSTSDAAFVCQMWPVLQRQLAYFTARVQNDTGLLLAREYTSFDDAVAYTTLQGTALNAFYIRALRDAAYLAAAAVGDEGAAASFAAAADSLVGAINARLWDDSAQAYSAGILPNGTLLAPSVHANMLMLDRGEVPLGRAAGARAFFLANYNNAGVFNVCTNSNFMQNLEAKVGVNEPVSMFWAFNVLYGIDTAAADAEVLSQMRSRWAPMIKRNDTGTLWESFQDSESAHNYGAVPAWFLSTRVLGVRRDAPAALRLLVVEPHLGGLTRAGGGVVTELGVVTVAWSVDGGRLGFTVALPAGARSATLRVPDADAATLELDGAPAPATQDGRYAVATLTASVSGSIALL